MRVIQIAVVVLVGFVATGPAREMTYAEESDAGGARPSFGGPNAVNTQVAEDATARENALYKSKLLSPYFELKQRIQERTGLGFSADYTAVYLSAGDAPSGAEDEAGSGIVRLYGAWELVGRDTENTGSLVYKVEHRHRYTTIAPQALGLDLGYAGLFEAPFNNDGWRLTNLYWKQRLLDGRFGFTLGFLDVTDYVDVFALASPWLGFNNFAFSTGSASIDLPNDATLGAAAAAWLNDKVYLIGGLTDGNADATDPFEGFDTFFDESEFFSSVEVGWTTAPDRYYFDNVHLTLWHADERPALGLPEGWGLNFSATYFTADGVMPFLRGGWTEESGSLLGKSVSAGVGYQPPGHRDLVGVGLNWGEPNETTFGPGLDDQYAVELFYRLQLTEEVAITPSVNLLIDPALSPEEDSIWVFGVRGRIAM